MKVGKHHFNFNPQLSSDVQSKQVTVEIDIKEHKFNRAKCLMLQIRNVTSAMDSYALQIDAKKQQQFKTSMQHEIVSHLTSIISVADLLKQEHHGGRDNHLADDISSSAH